MKKAGAIFEYLVGYVWGFVVVTFDDITMTSLALASVGLGFLTNALIAGVTYLFVYVFLRIVNSVSNSIGSGMQNVTVGLSNVAQAVFQTKTQDPVEETDPGS